MSFEGHVLVVEDSTPLSDAFRTMLEHSGFRVSVANSMADALEVEEQADVMLLDLSLPDGDGITLLLQLRELGRGPRYSIALTGHEDNNTRERCLSAGCADVMVKPIPPGEIVRRLRSLLA